MALAEFGDRPQILCAALAIRYGRVSPVLWGLGLATLCNCAISAVAGSAVHQWISEDPLQLFYALSLIFAGIGMVAWRRPTDLLDDWSLGPFWTSFLGLFILQFGDKGQFSNGWPMRFRLPRSGSSGALLFCWSAAYWR